MTRCEPPTKPTPSPPYPIIHTKNVGKGSSQASCHLAIMDPTPGEDKTLNLNPRHLNELQYDSPVIFTSGANSIHNRSTLPYLPPAPKINCPQGVNHVRECSPDSHWRTMCRLHDSLWDFVPRCYYVFTLATIPCSQ